MKKFTLAFVAALSLSAFSLTGCGGSGENTVVESTPAETNQMDADQQAQYEEQMKSGYGNRPGN